MNSKLLFKEVWSVQHNLYRIVSNSKGLICMLQLYSIVETRSLIIYLIGFEILIVVVRIEFDRWTYRHNRLEKAYHRYIFAK